MTTCSIEACVKPAEKRGWCAMHYARWRKHGSTETVLKVRFNGPPEERVWHRITATPFGCWQWTAACDAQGYGIFTVGGRNRIAHRYVYELLAGPIPDGLQVDHLCRNRGCVNPDHLEPVTAKVNTNRSRANHRFLLRTHCQEGHALTPENTMARRDSPGSRICRECQRVRLRNYMRAKRGTGVTYDAPNKAKTHCMHGHEFTEENTYRTSRGGRFCRQCGRDRKRAAATRKRAKETSTMESES